MGDKISDDVYRATEREVASQPEVGFVNRKWVEKVDKGLEDLRKKINAPVNYGDMERKLLMDVYGPTGRKKKPRLNVACYVTVPGGIKELEVQALEKGRAFFGEDYELVVVTEYIAHTSTDAAGEITGYGATITVEGTRIVKDENTTEVAGEKDD